MELKKSDLEDTMRFSVFKIDLDLQQKRNDAEEYKNLIKELSSVNLQQNVVAYVKEHFASEIESTRILKTITTFGELVQVLELRDIISENDVSSLKNVLERLKESQLNNDNIESCYKLLHCYKKLHCPENVPDGTCTVCDAPTGGRSPAVLNSIEVSPIQPSLDNNNNTNDLQGAIMLIKDHLHQKSWKNLGKMLKVNINKINELESQPRPTSSEYAQEILELWLRNSDATLEELVKALDHKWVARPDLSRKLKLRYNIK